MGKKGFLFSFADDCFVSFITLWDRSFYLFLFLHILCEVFLFFLIWDHLLEHSICVAYRYRHPHQCRLPSTKCGQTDARANGRNWIKIPAPKPVGLNVDREIGRRWLGMRWKWPVSGCFLTPVPIEPRRWFGNLIPQADTNSLRALREGPLSTIVAKRVLSYSLYWTSI